MERITLSAHAKVNLYLKVTGKRPDGYHDLVTVMQSVSLCDTLHFQKNDQKASKNEKYFQKSIENINIRCYNIK